MSRGLTKEEIDKILSDMDEDPDGLYICDGCQ